jgi:curved DNA-binding protein CbpA
VDDADLYAVLGVGADVDDAGLRRAWRALSLRWHPDRKGDTARFQAIAAAYEVLSDPAARAAYDRRRGVTRDLPAQRTPSEMLRRQTGPLNALLACGVARHAEEGVIELRFLPEEAAGGGMITISMRVPIDGRDELFSAWLAVPPGVADGTMLAPSVLLRGMRPVRFRVRVG